MRLLKINNKDVIGIVGILLTKQERLKCFGLVSYFDTNCICVELSAEEIKAASEAIEAKLKEKNT